jgi:hypothetical protein
MMEGEDFISEAPEPPMAFEAVCLAVLENGNGTIDLGIMANELGGSWLADYERSLDLHRAKQRK